MNKDELFSEGQVTPAILKMLSILSPEKQRYWRQKIEQAKSVTQQAQATDGLEQDAEQVDPEAAEEASKQLELDLDGTASDTPADPSNRDVQTQIDWVMKNIFIPAKMDEVFGQVLDKAFEENLAAALGIEKSNIALMTQKKQAFRGALERIKADITNNMNKMVKENVDGELSPYMKRLILKLYEVSHRKQD